jgi:hypothetical protein
MNQRFLIPLMLLLALASAYRAEGKVIYVHAAATGTNNGSSWANAFTTVYDALNAAQYADQVWVARGTYYATAGTDRTVSIVLKNGVQLLGGFAGTETSATQRRWRTYQTILSGDIGVRNDSLDNTCRIVSGSGLDRTTILDGFIVERGNANMDGFRTGAGLFLTVNDAERLTALKIANCIFRRNFAIGGAGIYCTDSNEGTCELYLASCQFMYNNVSTTGAGVYMSLSYLNLQIKQKINIKDCNFTGNAGKGTSAIHSDYAINISFERDTFTQNGRPSAGSTVSLSSEDRVSFTDCIFNQNIANNGSILSVFADTLVFNRLIFMDNTSREGITVGRTPVKMNDCLIRNFRGVNLLNTDEVVIRNTIFSGNQVDHIFRIVRNIHVVNSTFTGNSGNALFLILLWRGGNPALNVNPKTPVALQQCLFYNNRMKLIESLNGGAAVTVQSSSLINNRPADTLLFRLRQTDFGTLNEFPDTLRFNSCLFSGANQLPLFNRPTDGTLIEFSHSLFGQSSCTALFPVGQAPAACAGRNNLFGSPIVFQDTLRRDFRLAPCSAGLNGGDAAAVRAAGLTTDLNKLPRIENTMPDIGAFETKLSIERLGIQAVRCPNEGNGAVTYGGNNCAPLTFAWANGSTTGTTNDRLNAGRYIFTITDGRGFSRLDTVLVTAPSSIQVSVSVRNVSAAGTADGNVRIDAITGGTAPYRVLWSDGQTSMRRDSLMPGFYRATVTDANGCSLPVAIEIRKTTSTTAAGQLPFRVYPNPVATSQTFVLEGLPVGTRIQVIDGQGKIWHTAFTSNQLPISITANWPAGLYMVRALGTDGRQKVEKIILQ